MCSILLRFSVTFHPPGYETDLLMTSDDDGHDYATVGRSPRRDHMMSHDVGLCIKMQLCGSV